MHEESAVALAHGYARVTGRPLAVALHANVGLMHATMAIFNAWCDRIPMLLLGGGRADRRDEAPALGRLDPHVARSRRARARLHEVGRPARLGAAALEAIVRAYRIATTLPQGPVYVALDAALQEEALAAPVPLPALDRSRVATPGVAPAETVREAARDLLDGAASAHHDRPRVERSPRISRGASRSPSASARPC